MFKDRKEIKNMYVIQDYSCYDNYTVKSKTENVSNVVDKMIRITAKTTESFARKKKKKPLR